LTDQKNKLKHFVVSFSLVPFAGHVASPLTPMADHSDASSDASVAPAPPGVVTEDDVRCVPPSPNPHPASHTAIVCIFWLASNSALSMNAFGFLCLTTLLLLRWCVCRGCLLPLGCMVLFVAVLEGTHVCLLHCELQRCFFLVLRMNNIVFRSIGT